MPSNDQLHGNWEANHEQTGLLNTHPQSNALGIDPALIEMGGERGVYFMVNLSNSIL